MKAKTLVVRLQVPPKTTQPMELPPFPPATPPATTSTIQVTPKTTQPMELPPLPPPPPATTTTTIQEPNQAVKTEAVEEQQYNNEIISLEIPAIDTFPPSDSLGKRKRKPKEIHDEISMFFFRRRKKKPASKSKLVVENSGAKSLSHKQEHGSAEASNSHTPIKSPTLIRAEEVQSSLVNEYPSFLKSLLRSHVASSFWMGLPAPFCKQHLPREDIAVVLESESGEEFEIKYIAEKTGLSAGWRKFVVANKLLEGDVLIFQLIAPIKFKVYVIRANDLNEVDGVLSLLNLDYLTKQLDAEGIAALNDKKKHPKSLPLTLVQKRKKKEGTSGSAIVPVGMLEEQSGNDSDEVASEVQEGTKFHRAVTRFRDMKSFKDFHIVVNGVCIDSELPEHIRQKYYELCCSKHAFLHDRLRPGLYCKLAAGIIFELVNTADAIRSCKITTPRKEFDIWDKSLRSFELLGMNVGFIRARLRRLVSLAFDSEGAAEAKRYWEVKTDQARCVDEMISIEEKLEGLKETCERYDADIEVMKPGAESYELMFQEEVNAPFERSRRTHI